MPTVHEIFSSSGGGSEGQLNLKKSNSGKTFDSARAKKESSSSVDKVKAGQLSQSFSSVSVSALPLPPPSLPTARLLPPPPPPLPSYLPVSSTTATTATSNPLGVGAVRPMSATRFNITISSQPFDPSELTAVRVINPTQSTESIRLDLKEEENHSIYRL